VGRNRKDLAWISAAKLDCSYLRLSSVLLVYPSLSRSLLLRLSTLTHSLALFVAAGAQLRRFISTLRARSCAHSLAMRRSRRKRSRSARPPPPARRKTQRGVSPEARRGRPGKWRLSRLRPRETRRLSFYNLVTRSRSQDKDF